MRWLSFNRYGDVSAESDDESYEKVLSIEGIVSFCF